MPAYCIERGLATLSAVMPPIDKGGKRGWRAPSSEEWIGRSRRVVEQPLGARRRCGSTTSALHPARRVGTRQIFMSLNL